MEDALKRLDKLTQEEAWMGIAQNLRATHAVGESVWRVVDKVKAIDNSVASMNRLSSDFIRYDSEVLRIRSGNRWQQRIRKWLSSPDPSTNHNIACGTHHKNPRFGFSKAASFRSGSLRVRFSGFTENVCPVFFSN